MKRLNKILWPVVVLFLTTQLIANDIIPGEKQKQPIALINAKIFTVSGNIVENGTLIFEKGKISAVGMADIKIPDDAEVIDVKGKNVYPGIIAAYSQLGLLEIEAVRATLDYNEVGDFNPNVKAVTAYNPDSDIIPTVRSNGITTALIAPLGGTVSGISSLLNLDGWNQEDETVRDNVAMHLSWPRMTVRQSRRVKDSAEKQKKQMEENLQKLEKWFDDAAAYAKARKADPDKKVDIRFEAMIPVFEKKMPVIIDADEYKQIEAAVDFCKRHDLKMILFSGEDSWKLTDLLVENDIPVILHHTHALPAREDEDYDLPFKRPVLLKEAGVKFCLTKTSSAVWDIRNIPFYAGTAVTFGLSEADALKSITLWPAEILGVADKLGSLEVGKNATLIVSKGDILDMQTSIVELMFIDGRKVNIDDKQKRLYRKYEARYK